MLGTEVMHTYRVIVISYELNGTMCFRQSVSTKPMNELNTITETSLTDQYFTVPWKTRALCSQSMFESTTSPR